MNKEVTVDTDDHDHNEPELEDDTSTPPNTASRRASEVSRALVGVVPFSAMFRVGRCDPRRSATQAHFPTLFRDLCIDRQLCELDTINQLSAPLARASGNRLRQRTVSA